MLPLPSSLHVWSSSLLALEPRPRVGMGVGALGTAAAAAAAGGAGGGGALGSFGATGIEGGMADTDTLGPMGIDGGIAGAAGGIAGNAGGIIDGTAGGILSKAREARACGAAGLPWPCRALGLTIGRPWRGPDHPGRSWALGPVARWALLYIVCP